MTSDADSTRGHDRAVATAAGTDADAPPRVLLHMPVDVRSLSLVVLAVLAAIFALQWAKAIFVPILLGVMFSYALTPVVDRLQRWHRAARARRDALLLAASSAHDRLGACALVDDATALIETLPEVAAQGAPALESPGKTAPASTIDKVQQAANELEQAAAARPPRGARRRARQPRPAPTPGRRRPAATTTTSTTATTPAPAADDAARGDARRRRARRIQRARLPLERHDRPVRVPRPDRSSSSSSRSSCSPPGDTFRRKMVKLAGPRLSQKKITVQALDEVSEQIQRYLLVQLATSVVVGVATGLAFYALGLNNAAAWGVVRRRHQPRSLHRRA